MPTGLFPLPWWGYLIVLAVLTHATIISVTIFLHRAQAHRALKLHPLLSHGFRLWLWLTTGMVTREWIAVHRKHHACCDADQDPHSPQLMGISRVLWQGAELYRQALKDPSLIGRFGRGAPDDWIERHLYSRHASAGLLVMLAADLICFGAIGLSLWALQMIWIPFWAAGVINGLGHWSGYRNFETADASRNLLPVGILIGGEELHNNHHAAPASARMSCRWFELDLGWIYIRGLSLLGLVEIQQASLLRRMPDDLSPQSWHNRVAILRLYGKRVVLPIVRQECRSASRASRRMLKQTRWLMLREKVKLNDAQRASLDRSLALSLPLATVYEFQNRLRELWRLPGRSSERLKSALEEWCQDARQAGIGALSEFADILTRAQQEDPATD